MKIIAAVLLLLAAPLAAQTIAPSQIKPGTNGQSLQTVAGKAAWANSSTSVPSVFGRTGAILPVTGDYNCSQVSGSICSLPTLFNQLLQVDGASLTQRGIVNFINGSAGTVSCADNAVTLATDCTFTGGSSTGVTWTINTVAGSRTVGTAVQNTSTWPMFVGGSLATTGSGTGSITVAQGPTAFSMPLIDWKNQATATVSSGSAGFSAVINPGYWYVVQVSGAVTTSIQNWTELTGSGSSGGGGGGGGCAPSGGANALLKNTGSGTCGASSVSDNGSVLAGTEPATFPAVNTVINAGNSLSAAITACGSANTTIQITQTIAVGTGITVPANCTLLFQSAGNLTGTSITINGAVLAAYSQIFGAGLAVHFGALVPAVPVEWFGGKLDGTLTPGTGTDNCTPFAAALASLTNGSNVTMQAGNGTLIGYRTTCEVDITGSGTGIVGVALDQPYDSPYTGQHGSALILDSATINGIILSGNAMNNTVRNINVVRTLRPTGTTSMGVGVVGTSSRLIPGSVIEHNSSADSVNDFYFKGAAYSSGGRIAFNGAYWGNTGLGSPAGGACGFSIDSGDGTPSSSTLFTGGNSAQTNAGRAGLTGLCIKGVNVSDNVIHDFYSAGLDYGIDVENTGTTSFVAQDLGIIDSVNNACGIACIKINGAQSATDLAPHVYITGGNNVPTGTGAAGILVHNSSNVAITGVQILPGGSGIINILLDTVDGFTATNNSIDGLDFGSGVGISCLNSTKGTISNNQIKEYMSGTGIKNVGCTLISEQGNSIAAPTGGTLGTGISFDAASSNNGPWSLNNIDNATVTTPVSDAGTNNNTMRPTSLIAGTVTDSALTAGQQVVAGASGLLSNGGTAILSCADTSASGTAQSCTTSPSFTPAANSCVIYTTTTANSGTGLTLNVNSLGAKSVAKWLGTTALAAGDVAANSPQLACYNGTVWNLSTIGNAPSGGGGSITFPQTVAGTVNSGGLVYASSGTQISVSAAGTAGQVVLWGGAGTAPTAQAIGTSGSVIPLLNGANTNSGANTFSAAGAASTAGVTFTGAPFTGGSGTTTVPYIYCNNGATGPTTFSTSGTEIGCNAPSGWAGNFLDFHINGAASVFNVAANGATNGRSFSANGGLAQLTSTGFTEGAGIASIGTKFTTTGCSVSSTTGGASAGVFTLGANSCTVVLTMNGATGITAPNGWSCQAHDRTAPTVLLGGESSSTTTTASITVPAGAGTTDVISFACIAF